MRKLAMFAAFLWASCVPAQYVPTTLSAGQQQGPTPIILDVHNGASFLNVGSPTTSLSVSLTGVTQHDLITCEGIFQGASTFTHIADTLNGTFNNDIGPTKQTFENEFLVISSFPNSASGSDTITLTVTGNSQFFTLSCQAWKNAAQTSPVDAASTAKCSNGNCATNSSVTVSNATSNTISPSFASNDLAIGVAAYGSQTATAGSGFTLIDADSQNVVFPEYKIGTVPSAVPTSCAWVNTADNWITMYVTYKHA